MKNIVRLTASLCFVLLTLSARNASAQIFAADDAASYSNAPANAAWLSGPNTNGGFGFTPWVFRIAGPGFQGFFIGDAGTIASTNGNAWGMYANTGTGNSAVAFRGFANPLQANQVFKLRWKLNGVGFDTFRTGGFCLRNGNANSATTDFDANFRLRFYYLGGGSDSFLVWDNDGVHETGVGFGKNPLTVEVTLLTADTYRLVIKDATGATTYAVLDGGNLKGSGTIDSVSLFNFDAYGNQIFNNLQITSTSLVPPDIGNVQPTNGTIYASTASPLSFDVTSAFSTITSNNIQLSLNGAVQPNTNITFTGSGTASVHAQLNTALSNNVVYNGTIVATDANGNHATNTFTFNTWLNTNPFIESGDYNFTGGHWLDNFTTPQPNQAYAGLLGSNGIDYLEYDLEGTNNVYRPNDLPQIENATDIDHNQFGANSFQPYNLAFIKNGEFLDYTRRMSNVTYAVYARMSGFGGGSSTMLMERTATATVSTTNQPRASLGTFVCPVTGGPQNWTFVQLKDISSQPVLINFAGTNTFRFTSLSPDGTYNFAYVILVPLTNTATLRPYISSGFPFPGAGGVAPDQKISFTIANRQTSLSGTPQVFLNSNDISGSITLSNNAAGSVVSYQPPSFLPSGTNLLQVIYTDGSVSQTNSWTFNVTTLPLIPVGFALPLSLTNGAGNGFAEQIAKASDTSTNVDFPPTIVRALAQLAGTLTNSQTGLPYSNIAGGPNNDGLYTESNSINYDINATPNGASTFNFKTNFPYVPASGTNNFMALSANMYLQLNAGIYRFAVRSDDGFLLTTGPTPTSTNLTLGLFDAGRGNDNPTTFEFIVQTNGLYPMRLIYDQGEFGGNIEFYSIDRNTGTPTLINDPVNPNAVRAWLISSVSPIPLVIQKVGNTAVLTWSDASFNLQAAPAVLGTWTNITGATSPYTNTISGTGFFRLKH